MPKIIFKIDPISDEKNWRRIKRLPKLPYGLKKVRGKRVVGRKKIKDFSSIGVKKLKAKKTELEKYFKNNGMKFFKRIELVTNKPICAKVFNVDFTSVGVHPYFIKNNFFMISAYDDLATNLTRIAHEILHFQFHYYYETYCKKKGLKNPERSDLKEALTFLLNEEEFKDLLSDRDPSYPNHKILRQKLSKIWRKDRNFRDLLDQGIKLVKG